MRSFRILNKLRVKVMEMEEEEELLEVMVVKKKL